MKLWIDAQLPPAIAVWINAIYANVEAIAVRDVGMRKEEDDIIFFAARNASADVMTKDSDFVELQKRHGVPPKVIWVTCGNTSNKRLKEVLLAELQNALDLLNAGEDLVEITEG